MKVSAAVPSVPSTRPGGDEEPLPSPPRAGDVNGQMEELAQEHAIWPWLDEDI